MKLGEALKVSFKSEKEQLYLNVIYTSNMIKHNFDLVLKEYNISMQQYNVLRILKGSGKQMRVNDVKSRMLDKTPNLTRLTNKLIDKKYIKRVDCESDRRVIYIEGLEEGMKVYEAITEKINKIKEEGIHLSEEESLELNRLLNKLRNDE